MNTVQTRVYEEQRKIEDLQLQYEQAIRKCQRELSVMKEEAVEKDSIFEQTQKALERQTKELELRETQLDSAKEQGLKDRSEIRDLKSASDELQLEVERLRRDKDKRAEQTMAEGKTKEQLSKEKYELVAQLNELTHQLEVIKTQKETELHK